MAWIKVIQEDEAKAIEVNYGKMIECLGGWQGELDDENDS